MEKKKKKKNIPSVPLDKVLNLSSSCCIWPARPALRSRNCLRFCNSARFSLMRCCRADDCELDAAAPESEEFRRCEGRLVVRYDMFDYNSIVKAGVATFTTATTIDANAEEPKVHEVLAPESCSSRCPAGSLLCLPNTNRSSGKCTQPHHHLRASTTTTIFYAKEFALHTAEWRASTKPPFLPKALMLVSCSQNLPQQLNPHA